MYLQLYIYDNLHIKFHISSFYCTAAFAIQLAVKCVLHPAAIFISLTPQNIGPQKKSLNVCLLDQSHSFIDTCIARTWQFCASAMLLLLIVGNKSARSWRNSNGITVDTKLRKYLSVGSKV